MRWAVVGGLVLLVGVTSLVACDDNYGDAVERLEKFMASNQIGSGTDYWLVKRSLGVDDRVGLIFGYMDDNAGCMDIAQALNKKYPAANYTCQPANH